MAHRLRYCRHTNQRWLINDGCVCHWRLHAAASGIPAIWSLQQDDNLLRIGNERVGVRCGNGLAALGLNRIDESLKRIDGRDIVLGTGPVESVERRIQLRVQAVFNPGK